MWKPVSLLASVIVFRGNSGSSDDSVMFKIPVKADSENR